MKTITVNRFDGGMAGDIYAGAVGEFSVSKHFDIATYPNRLYPFRGMSADTANTGIGQIIVGSDGAFYGLGWSSANHAIGAIWKRTGGGWTESPNNAADLVKYGALVEYHDNSGAPLLFHSTASNQIGIVDPAFVASSSNHALTYANICQGFVHPINDILYFGNDNNISQNNNTVWTNNILVLPTYYRVTSLTNYGSYLAIAVTPSLNGIDGAGAGGRQAGVYLWDMTSTTWSEFIPWGIGKLQVLNNLDGYIVGISDTEGSSGAILDFDSVTIKLYSGSVPITLKEVSTIKQTSTAPDAVINPNVNFVYKNRLYFSANIMSGSTSPSYYGLWSFGKSKISNGYSVTIERVATVDNSEIAVLAAAIIGDEVSMCYNTPGTLSFTNTAVSAGDQWTASSVYESVVNPEMDAIDKVYKKGLVTFAAHYLPLPATGQVVAQYRVDGGVWTTIFTETTDGAVVTENTVDANGAFFLDGRNYEFRLVSTGFAQILGFTYKYEIKETNI